MADATADQAISLMLASARNLYRGAKGNHLLALEIHIIFLAMLGPHESNRDVNDFGQHFSGSTLGIVGLGKWGQSFNF